MRPIELTRSVFYCEYLDKPKSDCYSDYRTANVTAANPTKMQSLTTTQANTVSALIALFESAPSVDVWGEAFDAFLEDESFSFEQCEAICMENGWA